MLPSLSVGQSKSHTDEFGSHFERLQVHLNKWECRGKVHLHKFHNLSWITEINELFHDILIYWDAPVIYFYCKLNEPKHIGMWWLNPAAAVHSVSINRQQVQHIPAFCFGASWSVNRTCWVLYKERTSSILWWSPRKSDVDRCIRGWARAFCRGRFGCDAALRDGSNAWVGSGNDGYAFPFSAFCLSSQRCMRNIPGRGRHLLLPETNLLAPPTSQPSTVVQLGVYGGPSGGAIGCDAVVS